MSTFTAEQLDAIDRRQGSFALAAGAGSGKTSVLVERYVRAVVEDGVAPSRILAITFTDRAAGELRERVRRRLIECGDREAARESAAAFVSTFHGFCARLLRTHAALAGLAPGFTVLADGTATTLREEAFAAALERWLDDDRALALAAAFETISLREMTLRTYDELRSRGERAPALVHAQDPEALGAAEVVLLGRLLEQFGVRYADAKRSRGAVDFDDLELEAGALLAAHAEVRASWAERFEMIMVDELQDTNARQIALLAAIDRDNLFTVGDEHQSIYGFRHADVQIFRERAERLAQIGAAGALRTNFRSVAPLLAATGAVFAARLRDFAPLLPGRDTAVSEPVLELLLADRDGWEGHEERLGIELAPAPLWRRAEARLLAKRVDELIAAGVAGPEDVVVLLRAATQIGVYEDALSDLGHATLATAGGGFYERPEVIDLVAYLRVLANPLDDLALYGVLASPLCGAGTDTLAALAARSRERGRAPWELLELEPPDGATRELAARVTRAREQATREPLGATVAAAIADGGYERHLAGLHSPERRIANVRKLEELAREWERREGRDLRAFTAALSAGRAGAARETEAPPPAAGTGAIRLMTIHAAKGLEFPVVCVADLAHSSNTTESPLLTDGRRVGLRLVNTDRERVDALAYDELRAERRQAAAAEEERIIYVAMTRARDRLILSGAARFASWPRDAAAPISWLGPALVENLPALVANAAAGVHTVEGTGGVPVRVTLLSAPAIDQILGPPVPAREVPPARPREAEPGEQLTLEFATAARMPAALAAPPPTLSYSALADYERCAYRYHLQRVLGLPDEATGLAGEDAAARGSAVHALLERLDFAHPVLGGDDEVALLAGAFARSPLCARLAAARQVRREAAFAFVLGDGLLRGFLDVAAVEADGTILIVDYKSDRVADDEDLAAHVERDYAIQRQVYALAALSAGAPAVEVAHCFLRRPEMVLAARYEASERARLEAALAARVAPLLAGRFEVSPEPGLARCAGCPGRARLCSHDEAMTSREPLAAA